MTNALLSVQIIPKTKNGEDTIPFVDEAIAVIEESGVKYQVNPLETTMEGELSELFQIVEKMNQKMTERGCPSVISQVKVFYKPDGASMDQLTEKYR
ncbi:thiamine-binding protein [Oceanobacillus bengalensis]|uniref:Thiamine-binding protein n=1 Tax=Oceanobacillus bengalensis TaxID=1435466 RepID=A0A494Z3Q1_9BACI|nr:thiamine-binding protein [Oceanobacillus bengalensis]RKQ17155.1 thiamine-binding protein [Oceanobacillus bengalensis]